jgi:hypothetical protein
MAAQRVRGLRIHYRQLRDAIAALEDELGAAAGQAVDFTDIRQRPAWVLAGLRHQWPRESDLIYEAYYDASRACLMSSPGVMSSLATPMTGLSSSPRPSRR